MILAISCANEFNLVEKYMKWCKQRWCRGHILESDHAKLMWNFEFHLRKTIKPRRPDLMLENKGKEILWIYDMTFPQENSIATKIDEKQTTFELRKRRAG